MVAGSVALAQVSRLRAVAMVLVGLLLATVGTDIATGEARFTMGLSQLADGISSTVLALGLLVTADGLLCLASPSAYVESYARWVAGWFDRRLSTSAAIGLRVAGAMAVAAACYAAFALNNALWDVCVLLVLGAFGVVCKLIGANRLVLVMAFDYGLLIEENIRRALLISRGDPFTFLTGSGHRRPPRVSRCWWRRPSARTRGRREPPRCGGRPLRYRPAGRYRCHR